MINHTELRCGNKVHISGKEYPNERLVATVGEIHYFGSTLECDFGEGEGEGEEDCDIDHEDLIPIPLSEEWLIRAGFEKYSDKEFYIYTSKENEVRFYKSDSDWNLAYFITETRYVHQLQNLYFWLTGEELTFKDL